MSDFFKKYWASPGSSGRSSSYTILFSFSVNVSLLLREPYTRLQSGINYIAVNPFLYLNRTEVSWLLPACKLQESKTKYCHRELERFCHGGDGNGSDGKDESSDVDKKGCCHLWYLCLEQGYNRGRYHAMAWMAPRRCFIKYYVHHKGRSNMVTPRSTVCRHPPKGTNELFFSPLPGWLIALQARDWQRSLQKMSGQLSINEGGRPGA